MMSKSVTFKVILALFLLAGVIMFLAACSGESAGVPQTEAVPSVSPLTNGEIPADTPPELEDNTTFKANEEASPAPAENTGDGGTESPAPSPVPEENTEAKPEAPPSASPESGGSAKAALISLSIRCDVLVNNSKLDPGIAELVPSDGVLFFSDAVEFSEGETVFDVLKRELIGKKIHLEFVEAPGTGAAYIEGIANIYEFDCGELSGWLYTVNGVSPGYTCSGYTLSPGDKVEWLYTCDLGSDLGLEVSGGLQ